jgi:hypothetical protein
MQKKGEQMKKFCGTFAGLIVASVLSSSLTCAQAQEGQQQVDRYITLLRTDVKAQKAAVVVSNMHFTDTESDAFWPVYQQYQKELSRVGDEKVAVIKDYAAHLDHIDDKKATELTAQALAVEEQRLQVIKKYIGELSKVLPAKQVARFFQLELQMQRLIDLQVAAELPLVE